MNDQKKKTIGKVIIVILGVAIVGFLLLPFLDNSSTTTQAKKATPQIFTSNPLSSLVRKVYGLFARNSKKRAAAARMAYEQTKQGILTDGVRADDLHANSLPGSTQVNATYDQYADAEFINEDGEWILVRQTTPESSQRGMHEINTSDSAYDRYVRQARAARWTGHTATPQQEIPDSKWARMWNPISR